MSRGNIARSLALALALIFAAPAASFARIVDKIVAVVNNEAITQSEVDRLLYPIYLQYTKIYRTDEEVYKNLDERRTEILKQLVSDKLILSEARRLDIKVDEKEIDGELDALTKDLLKDGMKLDDVLKEQNLTLGDLRNRYREQKMIQKTVDQEIMSRISVQPSEASDYYLTHVDEYTQPEQVAVYSILIKLESVRTPLESRQLADEVHKMLLAGADFKETARNYSEGPGKENSGDLGYVERYQLLKEIDNVIFFLKVGEISNVVETPVGYHIFKAYDRKDEKVLPFEEARPKVMEKLFRAKAQQRFEEWLEKLKSNAYISIR